MGGLGGFRMYETFVRTCLLGGVRTLIDVPRSLEDCNPQPADST